MMIERLAVHHVLLAITLSVGMKTVDVPNSVAMQALNNSRNNLVRN
jgi:hypothetical protein